MYNVNKQKVIQISKLLENFKSVRKFLLLERK